MMASKASLMDYRSQDVIEARLKEMLLRVEEKTQSDLNENELLRAAHALVGCVTTKKEFRERKLLHVERVVFEAHAASTGSRIQRPATADLERYLSPWLELANFAYDYHEDGMPLEAAIQELMGLDYVLVRHCTDVETGGVGYYLAVDPKQKNVLIGIKGTSTTSEMITDCLATTIPHKCTPHSPFHANSSVVQEIGAHEGILASSIKVCDELLPILNDKVSQGYSIQLVGHSLGAGAASVVAVLLRAQYPDLHAPHRLHAYCFATPPVLDHRAAELSKEFITAVINRNDCVARMAIANVEILVKMLEGLDKRVMREAGLMDFWSIAKESITSQKIKHLTDDQFQELVKIMEESQAAVQIDDKLHLYVPGNIIALYGTMTELPAEGEEAVVTIKAAYVGPSHTFLRYFEVNDRMISDHLVPAYRESLEACIEQRKQTEVVPESESTTATDRAADSTCSKSFMDIFWSSPIRNLLLSTNCDDCCPQSSTTPPATSTTTIN